jgi:hypothetical protein
VAAHASFGSLGRSGEQVKWLRSFGAFWSDFVIGDDWQVAAVVVVAFGVTALVVHEGGVNVWWLLPLAVFAALGWSLRRATARKD